MAAPPSPNHVFKDEPHDFDDSDLEFEEDPQEEFEEDSQEDPEEEPEDDPEVEPEEASEMEKVAREGTRVENIKLKRELEASEISNTLLHMGQERTERELIRLRAWTYEFYEEIVHVGVVGVRPLMFWQFMRSLSLPSSGDHLVAPNAEAIAEYERNRTNPENAGGSGPANAGGVVAPDVHGCSYKTFKNCQPHLFNGTEGVVGLTRWFEEMEQVFEISKCAEEDKVKFAICTFEGRALTWWNGNVHTLGLANAN
ncbi:hypothetical protein Tco_0827955 [Tanacetum coccineum]